MEFDFVTDLLCRKEFWCSRHHYLFWFCFPGWRKNVELGTEAKWRFILYLNLRESVQIKLLRIWISIGLIGRLYWSFIWLIGRRSIIRESEQTHSSTKYLIIFFIFHRHVYYFYLYDKMYYLFHVQLGWVGLNLSVLKNMNNIKLYLILYF